MARGSRNAALIESEALSPEETKLMEDNRAGDQEPYVPDPQPTPEPAPVVTPEPAAKTEPAKPDATTKEPTPAEKRMVEYGALHEERQRRKEEREKREKAEADLNTLKGRFSTLEELARAAQPKPVIPDVNADPVAHFQAQIAERDARLKENETRLQQFEQWRQQQEQQRAQQEQITTVRNYAQQAETVFAKETPDYTEAANYVQMVRNAQLEAIGVTDPQQRAQQLALEALNLAHGAMQRGQNPAQVVYQMAKASGWKAKAAEPDPVATPSNTMQQPATPPAAAATQKLEKVVQGQKANQSLSQVSGSGAPTEPSIEALLKMSDEDFEKATKGDNWRKLFA